MPSAAARSPSRSGPARSTVASAESCVGVRPASSCRRSLRESRAMATRSLAASITGSCAGGPAAAATAVRPGAALPPDTLEAYVAIRLRECNPARRPAAPPLPQAGFQVPAGPRGMAPWIMRFQGGGRGGGGGEVAVAPSVSYSITVRLEVPSRGRAVSELTHAVEHAGGAVTALDVTPFRHERLRVDVTCAARDTEHAEQIVQALSAIDGVVLSKVSDRTFLLHLGGKIETQAKVPLRNRDDLSMAYTPGVARVSLAIAANPDDVRRLTIKRNSVAVVTDGSAVLGLGNVGPYAALPVMEGKAALFKRFAGIDAWPVCLDTQDTDEIVRTVQIIAPAFGGINLEDIGAPRCFEVEQRLRELLDIPVFHDDQHGTAIVVLAALTNALRVVGKKLASVRIVMAGAGAAGTAVLNLLLASGASDVIVCDDRGAVYVGRPGLG